MDKWRIMYGPDESAGGVRRFFGPGGWAVVDWMDAITFPTRRGAENALVKLQDLFRDADPKQWEAIGQIMSAEVTDAEFFRG